MTNFLPLFTNISTINVNCDMLDLIQNEHAELAMPMLTATQVLLARLVSSHALTRQKYNNHRFFSYDKLDNWFCDWLHTPREDGNPRVLLLLGDEGSFSHSRFIRHVKKVIIFSIE
jgi:hypothetical protein